MTRAIVTVLLVFALLGGIWMIEQYVGCNVPGCEMHRQGFNRPLTGMHIRHDHHYSNMGFGVKGSSIPMPPYHHNSDKQQHHKLPAQL